MSIVPAPARGPDLPVAHRPAGTASPAGAPTEDRSAGAGGRSVRLAEGLPFLRRHCGEMAEWSKAHAWKVCRRGTVSRVRIPLSPPPILGSVPGTWFTPD